ncbi:MAG: hypothetical protein ACI9ON_001724 [Limisphaerales bacterium]|jgi:hypothetical protein
MSKGILEKMAVIGAVVVIGCALWFWSGQVQSVIELLEMAG